MLLTTVVDVRAGVATSSDGVNWRRGTDAVAGRQGDSQEVGLVLGPNADNWWWHDTCHLSVSDVQVWCCSLPFATAQHDPTACPPRHASSLDPGLRM